MFKESVLEILVKVVGVQDEVWILFEEIHRERLGVGGINEVAIYFMDSEEVLPFLTLGGVLGDVGVECFRYAIECEAVVCGEDEFLFEPEAFLEFFDV